MDTVMDAAKFISGATAVLVVVIVLLFVVCGIFGKSRTKNE